MQLQTNMISLHTESIEEKENPINLKPFRKTAFFNSHNATYVQTVLGPFKFMHPSGTSEKNYLLNVRLNT